MSEESGSVVGPGDHPVPVASGNRAFGPCPGPGRGSQHSGVVRTGRARVSAAEGDTAGTAGVEPEEEFKPTGTIFLLGCFVAMLILLWVTVYLILLSRGATG